MSAEKIYNDINNEKSINQAPPIPNYYSITMNLLSKLNSKHSAKFEVRNLDFENETPAFISIVPDMKNISKINAKSFDSPKTKFMLNNFEEQRKEKFQLFESFGEPSIFFFGERVRYYAFSGYMLDSKYTNSRTNRVVKSWANSFKKYWDDNFRGSKLVEKGQLAIITFNKNVMWGYPVSLTFNNSAQAPFLAGFSFNMVIVKHKINESKVSHNITDLMGSATREKFDLLLANLKETQGQINTILMKEISEGLSGKEMSGLHLLKEDYKKNYENMMALIQTIVKISGI